MDLIYQNTKLKIVLNKIYAFAFDCTKFEERTYMHVNPVKSDYLMRHNAEYQEFKPVSLNCDENVLYKQGLTFLKDIKFFYSNF